MRENAGGRIGIGKRWDTGGIQHRVAGIDRGAAHPTREHRLPRVRRLLLHGLRGAGRIGDALWCVHDQQPVTLLIGDRDTHRLRVPIGARIAEDVDGIVVAPRGWQQRIQPVQRGLRERGQLTTVRDQRIGRQHPGTAGIRENRETRASRARLCGEDLRHVEQLGDAVDAQHAAASERRVQHQVAAGERPGVGDRRFRGRLRPPGLDHDDWLGERDLSRGREKCARITN